MLLASLVGVVLALLLLGGAFSLAEGAAPSVEQGPPSSCPVRNLTDCNACIHAVGVVKDGQGGVCVWFPVSIWAPLNN